MSGDESWVDRRTPAVEQILDAVGELSDAHGVGSMSMSDIAAAAGCSRATLYRYFPDRPTLELAYVQRAAARVGELIVDEVARANGNPITEAVLSALHHVRATPALAAWFRQRDAAHSSDLAQHSEVIAALGLTLVPDPLAAAWLLRVVLSLLTTPGASAEEERLLVERFVVPVVGVGVRP